MKLAIIRQRYNPYGGAERFVERALAVLVEEGAEITLITRGWSGAGQSGFRQVICDPPYSRIFGGRAARDRSFATAAAACAAEGHYDIIQSHERIPGCTIFRAGDGVHAAWLKHRDRANSLLQRMGQRISPYHRYILAAEKAMFAHPDLKMVICNSRMVADEIVAHYGVSPEKLTVIYNGIDTEAFTPQLRREFRDPVRARMGIPHAAPVLLFVGSGFARKGVPQLCRAFARMGRTDAHLLIVGADNALKAMRQLANRLGIADRVHFTGPQQDVRHCYGAADGFVLPTLYDPCPNAALEALACGLPIVTSTTCGAQELVSPGQNGWVIDAMDVAGLSAHLDMLCGLTGNEQARAAARASVEHLTLKAMAGQLLDLYRSPGMRSAQPGI